MVYGGRVEYARSASPGVQIASGILQTVEYGCAVLVF